MARIPPSEPTTGLLAGPRPAGGDPRPGSPRAAGAERPYLEIQYHPANIRRGVRYLFLTRRQTLGWGLGTVAYLAFIVFTLWISPSVVGNVLAIQRHRKLVPEIEKEGQQLGMNVAKLGEIADRIERLRVEVSLIYLAYGVTEDASRGKGGYPQKPESTVRESVYADTIRRGHGLEARINEQSRVLEVFLSEIQSFEQAHQDQVRRTPSVSPIASQDFVLTSPFGSRRSPFTQAIDFHAGIDMAAATGTPIRASADGVVAFAGWFPQRQDIGWWRYGKLVALEHGERFLSLYGHCEELRVRTGDRVERGQIIATVGNTGWSTNPHLHYEIRRKIEGGDWQPVDPRIYILDHEWRDEERLLIRARRAPDARDYEPLPRVIGRR